MKNFSLTIESPLGLISLISDETHLKSLTFDGEQVEDSENQPEILRRTALQLKEYFSGTRIHFDLDIDADGTGFQQKVWQKLIQVPYGLTKSYRDIAVELGSVLNSRAVGTANGKNPVLIVVPCHRIVGQDGKLAGYSGGLERKKWLLLHEAKQTQSNLLFWNI